MILRLGGREQRTHQDVYKLLIYKYLLLIHRVNLTAKSAKLRRKAGQNKGMRATQPYACVFNATDLTYFCT